MKKYIVVGVLAIFVAFTPFYYANADGLTQAQYVSILEQIITLLEQELAALQTQPATNQSMTDSTPTPEVSSVPVTPIQVYQLVYQTAQYAGQEDLYLWANMTVDPSTVTARDAQGDTLPITFSGQGTSTQNCRNIQPTDTDTNVETDGVNPVKVCGGYIQRLVPSATLANAGSFITVEMQTTDGQTYSQKVPLPVTN